MNAIALSIKATKETIKAIFCMLKFLKFSLKKGAASAAPIAVHTIS